MLRAFPVGAFCLTVLAAACGRTPVDVLGVPAPADPTPNAHPRQPYFTAGSESYRYYEGASVRNTCTQDRDCLVTGCGQSTCAAEVMEISDNDFCEQRFRTQWPEPQLGHCGCLERQCLWYFESDYDRACEEKADCGGLGPPPARNPAGRQDKGFWSCVQGRCEFL